jgi:hypothetical protein
VWRPPGGCQVCSSERDWVEDGHVDMACCTGVFAVELHYLQALHVVVYAPPIDYNYCHSPSTWPGTPGSCNTFGCPV